MSEADAHPSLLGDIADGLEDGTLSPLDAARKLREAAAENFAALDADEIEMDFDLTGPIGVLASLGGPKPENIPTDPVDAALLHAIRLRDRKSALKIVGDDPAQPDVDAYQDALEKLRGALNTKAGDA